MRHSHRTLALFALSCCPLAAQAAFTGADIVVANYRTTPGLFRVAPNRTVTPLALGVATQGLSGLVGTRRGELLVLDADSGNVLLLPRTGPATVIANVPGCLRAAEDIDGEFVVTSFTSRSIERVTRAGQVSNVLTLASPSRPFDIAVDRNGDYLFCDDTGQRGVFRVDRATRQVSPIHVGMPLRLPQGLALFSNGDFAVIDGLADEVYRIQRPTSTISVFVPNSTLGNNPDGITEAFDGGFYVSTSSSVLNSVVRLDTQGALTPVASGAPFSNLEDVTVVQVLTGPTGVTSGPNATYGFRLELPLQPARLFSVGLSGSLYPGVPFPGGDARALAANADGLFLATLFRNLAPVFTGWTGVTDAGGSATLLLDLRPFPPGTFAGLTLFAQGITVDWPSPTGIGGVSNPLRIGFQ
jgi:hypothetical protein